MWIKSFRNKLGRYKGDKTLYLSTIGLAELTFGIAVLPEGKRKDMLHSSLEQRVLPLLEWSYFII